MTETLVWNGIAIEVAYEADWLNSSKGHFPTSHPASTSINPERASLPFTETGYLSHFLESGAVEAEGWAGAAAARFGRQRGDRCETLAHAAVTRQDSSFATAFAKNVQDVLHRFYTGILLRIYTNWINHLSE